MLRQMKVGICAAIAAIIFSLLGYSPVIAEGGNDYVTDTNNNRSQESSSTSAFLPRGSYGTGVGRFDGPVVLAADQSGTATDTETFTIVRAPKITSFTPTSGAASTVVTVKGKNLTGTTAVKFNGKTASVVSNVTATSLKATVPSGATTGKISVTTPGGTATSTGTFTVTTTPKPTITSFTPTSGIVGAVITITGTNLTGTSAVKFNGTTASVVSNVTATSLKATVPSGATTGKISVTTPGGTATSTGTFTVTVPLNGDLPDTGQTQSYTATFGEDHDYSINPPSYTDNHNGTVTDNVTGLIWQQNTVSGSYNWYQAAGVYDATYNPATQNVCRAQTTGGYTDWCLPTKKELMRIVDYGGDYPAIDPIFTGTEPSYYWSSTTYAYDSDGAWFVNFSSGYVGDGYVDNYYKAGTHYVRCVRGGQ